MSSVHNCTDEPVRKLPLSIARLLPLRQLPNVGKKRKEERGDSLSQRIPASTMDGPQRHGSVSPQTRPAPVRGSADALAVDDQALASECDVAVLITGPTASEVKTTARRIHDRSDRATAPFVDIRAGALPIDAELLAKACSQLLDSANGGSLLLADVEDMPAAVQRVLMELLEQLPRARAEVRRARLMAGTTVSVFDRVSAGTFSPELFYRLNAVHVVRN